MTNLHGCNFILCLYSGHFRFGSIFYNFLSFYCLFISIPNIAGGSFRIFRINHFFTSRSITIKKSKLCEKKLWNQFSLFFSSLENGSFQKKTSQFRLHCFIRKWKCPNKWETNFIFYVWSERNLRIGIYNGEMVFNRLLGNGWSNLDDFFGRSHEILIPMKWWKNQPSSIKFCITHIAGFSLILACFGPN